MKMTVRLDGHRYSTAQGGPPPQETYPWRNEKG